MPAGALGGCARPRLPRVLNWLGTYSLVRGRRNRDACSRCRPEEAREPECCDLDDLNDGCPKECAKDLGGAESDAQPFGQHHQIRLTAFRSDWLTSDFTPDFSLSGAETFSLDCRPALAF